MKHKVLKGSNGRLYLLDSQIHYMEKNVNRIHSLCDICAIKKLVDKRHQDGIGCYEIIKQIFGKHVGCAGIIFKDITEGL